MPESLKSRPVVPVALAYGGGCALSLWSAATPFPAAVAGCIAAVAAVAAFARGHQGWTILLAAMALLGFGRAATVRLPGPADPSLHAGRIGTVVLEGWVSSEPELSRRRATFVLMAESLWSERQESRVDGAVQVVLPVPAGRESALPDYGRRVRVGGQLVLPFGPREPGGFSYRAYLARQGIFCVLRAAPASVKVLTSRAGNPAVAAALRARRWLNRLFLERLPAREAGLVSGMLLGSYSMVPEDLLENFRRSGTLHLLAASGFNCGLIVLIFWRWLLFPLGAPRAFSLLLVIALVIFYVLMVGGKPSIMRAGVGATLYLMALLIGRPADMVSVLFGTVFIILLLDPLAIANVGFQLSFAAVGSIIAFVPRLSSLSRLKARDDSPSGQTPPVTLVGRFIVEHFRDVALVTVAATLATAPILAYYFNRVSLVSLPANLAVALLAETLFAAGVALAFLFWIPGAGWLLSRTVEWLASATAAVVDALGSLPMAEIHWPTPGLPAIASWYALMAAVWWLLQTADPRGTRQRAKTPEHSR
ncbi:MAG: hypothetical protein KatS3mg024_1629 [Armatimonadota bacterium]|nr:MAG: hypothetical protein KatS3mg024_1629 [Armatimonadota bacterium]